MKFLLKTCLDNTYLLNCLLSIFQQIRLILQIFKVVAVQNTLVSYFFERLVFLLLEGKTSPIYEGKQLLQNILDNYIQTK